MKFKKILTYALPLVIGASSYSCIQRRVNKPIEDVQNEIRYRKWEGEICGYNVAIGKDYGNMERSIVGDEVIILSAQNPNLEPQEVFARAENADWNMGTRTHISIKKRDGTLVGQRDYPYQPLLEVLLKEAIEKRDRGQLKLTSQEEDRWRTVDLGETAPGMRLKIVVPIK